MTHQESGGKMPKVELKQVWVDKQGVSWRVTEITDAVVSLLASYPNGGLLLRELSEAELISEYTLAVIFDGYFPTEPE